MGEYKSEQQVAELIKEVDTSGNGQIEFGEFIYMVGQIRLGKTNGLGKLVSTSKVSLYKFTDAELAELKIEFGNYDTSGDGRCAALFQLFVFERCEPQFAFIEFGNYDTSGDRRFDRKTLFCCIFHVTN